MPHEEQQPLEERIAELELAVAEHEGRHHTVAQALSDLRNRTETLDMDLGKLETLHREGQSAVGRTLADLEKLGKSREVVAVHVQREVRVVVTAHSSSSFRSAKPTPS